ncbi:CAP domain-containing protein [Chryseomicrobium sp. FSL W7-1435]|uniref:CAP domain-containing protein n=1 Tax=Chryseomicrobium sp. FSL W7-1435 TaxID=2921704 RepID=UPI003159DB1A
MLKKRLVSLLLLVIFIISLAGCVVAPIEFEISPTEKVRIVLPNSVEPVDLTTYEQSLLDKVNEARAEVGVDALLYDPHVAKVAQLKAQDLLTSNYFDHVSPTYGGPSEMLTEFGVEWMASGENIAAGQLTVEEVHEGWMNSPGHYENIVNPMFTHIGFGFTEGGGDYGTYWVQMFTAY